MPWFPLFARKRPFRRRKKIERQLRRIRTGDRDEVLARRMRYIADALGKQEISMIDARRLMVIAYRLKEAGPRNRRRFMKDIINGFRARGEYHLAKAFKAIVWARDAELIYV